MRGRDSREKSEISLKVVKALKSREISPYGRAYMISAVICLLEKMINILSKIYDEIICHFMKSLINN